MTHIGIICPPLSGHLNPMTALGRELQSRGHRVTVFGVVADIKTKVEREGLEFEFIGASEPEFDESELEKFHEKMGQLSGLQAMGFALKTVESANANLFQYAPDVLKKEGVDLLLVDQGEPAGGTVAEYLEIPFITTCIALAMNREPTIPPVFTPWQYQTDWWSKRRNQIGYWVHDWFTQKIAKGINQQRREWGLATHRIFDDSFSQLAQICQQPPDFDFPRTTLPKCFHYTGPFRNPSPQSVSFPWDKLNGKPVIYASLGTMQNKKQEIFHCIAEACEGLDVQLVITHGGGMSDREVDALPGSPLVVSYAPQVELLAKATLTITHGGLNTVLDSLSQGVPVIIIPITYEHPATASRLHWAGAGQIIPLDRLSVSRLWASVQHLLTDDSYRKNAAKLKDSIEQAGGVKRAANIIEEVIKTGKPVLANHNGT